MLTILYIIDTLILSLCTFQFFESRKKGKSGALPAAAASLAVSSLLLTLTNMIISSI